MKIIGHYSRLSLQWILLINLLVGPTLFSCSRPISTGENTNTPEVPSVAETSVLSFPAGNKITVASSDRDKFIANLLGHEYLRQPSSTEFYWIETSGSDVMLDLNDRLTHNHWQLVTDWGHRNALILSAWKKADLELSILLFDDLDAVGIESLSENYGISDPVPGSTMIVLHLMKTVAATP